MERYFEAVKGFSPQGAPLEKLLFLVQWTPLGTVFPRSPLPGFSPLSLDLPYVVVLGEAP